MSPLDALPVPLVGSNPFPSDGSRTVRFPPGRGGSVVAPGTVVVVRSWFTAFGSVVVVADRTLVLDLDVFEGFAVVVELS
jgi:hypothetical protein